MVGVNITFIILAFVLPLLDSLDYFLLTNPIALTVFIATSLVALAYHPCVEKWNDARADTTVIMGVVNGVFISSFIQNQLSDGEGDLLAPHPITWPEGFQDVLIMFVREFIGLSIMVLVHLIIRPLMVQILSVILGRKIDRNNNNPKETVVEFPYKYVSYLFVGISAFWSIPLFPLLGL